jgi:WD40 repeat protein
MRNYRWLIWVVLCAFGLQITAAQPADQTVTVERLEWRPHSNQVSLGLSDGQVLLHDLTTQETIALPRHTEDVTDLAWNRAGTQLISVSLDGSWHIWNAETQAVRTYIPPPPPPGSIALDDLLAAAWSTDGNQYALGTSYGVVSILDADTGLSDNAFFLTEVYATTSATPVSGMAWNRDDTELYVVSAYGGVVWDVRENRLSQMLSMPPSDVDSGPDSGFFAVDYSPQENALALGTADATTAIWDFNDGSSRILQVANTARINFVVEVQWGPFQQVLSVTREGQAQLWDVGASNTMSLLPIPGVSQAVWSPYGGRIAYIERNAQVADTTQGGPLFTVPTIVPAPSLDRLNAIAALCVQDGNGELDGVQSLLSAPATQAGLSDYVSRISNLPDDAIPPACAADLLAVAETLMAND